MVAIILSAFTLGILGSLHCIGMCGPLVMSMPFQKVREGSIYVATINYHLGKTLTYAFLGLLAGGIGQGFAFFKWQQILSISAGIILLLITFFPFLKKNVSVPKSVQQGFSRLYSLAANRFWLSEWVFTLWTSVYSNRRSFSYCHTFERITLHVVLWFGYYPLVDIGYLVSAKDWCEFKKISFSKFLLYLNPDWSAPCFTWIKSWHSLCQSECKHQHTGNRLLS
jgi:hypothetical protein